MIKKKKRKEKKYTFMKVKFSVKILRNFKDQF